MWEYIWTVYRIAEPQNDRTKAGEAFVELMNATEKCDTWWRFTGEAIAIEREAVYRIVEPHVRRAKSNFLIETKPPHKFLRRLAATDAFVARPRRDEEAEREPPSLGSLFDRDPSNAVALEENFDCTATRIDFCGFPLIGWTREHVWFGVTPFRYLWLQAPEVRAAALEYPLRTVPEFLRLPWSPAPPEWVPPLDSTDDWYSVDLQSAGPDLFRCVGDWEKLPNVPCEGARLLTNRIGAPDVLWVAKSDHEMRAALSAMDDYRDEHVFGSAVLITNSEIESVAQDVHVMQARSRHPIQVFYLSGELLLNYGRHFPWIFWRGPVTPRLGLHGDTLPQQLLMTCFLEAWHGLLPYKPTIDTLQASWREIGTSADFNTTLQELITSDVITRLYTGGVALRHRRFGNRFPTESPYTQLADAIEDWFLEHGLDTRTGYRFGPSDEPETPHDELWRDVVFVIARRSRHEEPIRKQTDRPFRALHALETLLERFSDNNEALREAAKLHLVFFDVARGVELLNRLVSESGPGQAHEELRKAMVDAFLRFMYERLQELLTIVADSNGILCANRRHIEFTSVHDLSKLMAHRDENIRQFAAAANDAWWVFMLGDSASDQKAPLHGQR